MRQYDTVVIGAGPGGYECALELADGGQKTLLIDAQKERIGGTCLNEGCIPAKSYLESALYAARAEYFRECGLDVHIGALDLSGLKEKTKALVAEIRSGVVWKLDRAGVELYYGQAEFVDAHTIKVAGERIGFTSCVIATGSQFKALPNLPVDGERILFSRDVFELGALPKSIAIIGGGPIGCEMASFFNAFGVEVSLIQRGERLLGSEDADLSKELLRQFKKHGIAVYTSSPLEEGRLTAEGVELHLGDEAKTIIVCEKVLCATGRTPNTDGLTLEKAGVALDAKGFIRVDATFATVQRHIYAVGDCIDTSAFAHTAYAEARIAAHNIVAKGARANTHVTPSVIFSHPQAASCGLSEVQANAEGRAVEVKKAYYKANAKAKIAGDDSGFVKMVVCANTGAVLGACVIGAEATEIIHELVLGVEKQLAVWELRGMIYAHPTVSEIWRFV